MRPRLLLAALLALATAAPGLASPEPASADTGGSVASLVATPGPLHVDGLTGTGIAHISITAADTRGRIGVCQSPDFETNWFGEISLGLERTSGGPPATASVDLRTHTTAVDGEHWSGDWRVAATRDGTWTITSIWARSEPEPPAWLAPTPSARPTLAVR